MVVQFLQTHVHEVFKSQRSRVQPEFGTSSFIKHFRLSVSLSIKMILYYVRYTSEVFAVPQLMSRKSR